MSSRVECFQRFALVAFVLLCHSLVVVRAVDSTRTLQVRDRVVASDGVVSFDVVVPDDGSLAELGRVEVAGIDVVSSDFSSYAYENDVLIERTEPVPETSCAYAGYTESSVVSLVSCGPRGPIIVFTLPDGTTYRAHKSDGDHANVEGAYVVDVFVGDETRNGTSTAVDGAFGSIGRSIDAQMYPPKLDLSFVQFPEDTESSARKRRRLLQGTTTQRVTFDYVFVSDHKRYLNYGGDEAAVLADTIAEIAATNAIYLVGDRFTPQIQFRMRKHIIWTTLPSIVTQSNVETGSYDDVTGSPQNTIDLPLYLQDFGKYAFHVSEYDLITKQAVTGDMKTIGDEVHGWHLLSGNFGGMFEGHVTVGLAMTNTTCYTFSDDHRSGCATLLADDATYESFYAGQVRASDSTGTCVPNLNYGLTSTLNTPGHYFPGLVLAHELGHNLGFMHVYEDGDDSGNVDSCLTNNPHNDTAVMGYAVTGTNAMWSQCSVNKFHSQWASTNDYFGNPTGEGGLYSCASNNYDTTKLGATTGPFAAFTTEESLHHVNDSYAAPSSTPTPTPTPTISPSPPSLPSPPSPPPAPLPEGHVALAYKLTITDASLSDNQKSVLRQAILQNNGVHDVAT